MGPLGKSIQAIGVIRSIRRLATPYAAVYNAVLLVCGDCSATDFIKKIANHWRVVVEAEQDRVAFQERPSKRVRFFW